MYFCLFLEGLNSQYAPPELDAVARRLTELASFTRDALRSAISAAEAAYAGLSFRHAVTDLWTEEKSHMSYGSLVARLTDLDAEVARDLPLGVWLCSGRHNHKNIRSWFVNRPSFFGVEPSYVLSATTD